MTRLFSSYIHQSFFSGEGSMFNFVDYSCGNWNMLDAQTKNELTAAFTGGTVMWGCFDVPDGGLESQLDHEDNNGSLGCCLRNLLDSLPKTKDLKAVALYQFIVQNNITASPCGYTGVMPGHVPPPVVPPPLNYILYSCPDGSLFVLVYLF
jgi:hypothetical protein